MSRYLQILMLTLVYSKTFSQDFTPLINMAWENNQELKSKNFQIESATQALMESKAMYGPEVKFGVQ